MSEGNFEGKSKNGDIQEALDDAIGAAKTGLKSERVSWRLEQVSGEDGGFVPDRDLRVKIHARSGSGGADPKPKSDSTYK